MSTAAKKKSSAPLAVATVSRKPQQGRSKASLERMLGAAREIMLERGSEEFTLQEVSQRGNVSIGSIYLRFESKDNLVRAVIADALDQIAADEEAMLAKVIEGADNLSRFVPSFVERYAEVLRQHAPLLRIAMQRASFDPLVSEPGKVSAFRSADAATSALLRYANEITGDAQTKANAAYQIIFATLARKLSLGSTGESVHAYDWSELKRELGRMCLAYLRSVD